MSMSSISPSDEVGLSPELYQVYQSLGTDEGIRKHIDEMKTILLENCNAGEKIQRIKIPQYYLQKYGVNNLYRYRLPDGYRGIYTILVNKGKVQSWILAILKHGITEKRLGYS